MGDSVLRSCEDLKIFAFEPHLNAVAAPRHASHPIDHQKLQKLRGDTQSWSVQRIHVHHWTQW